MTRKELEAKFMEFPELEKTKDLEQCYNCDEYYEWKEVPRGWDEEYCDECNEELNPYLCNNCNEEVEEENTFCSKWCSQEYWL